MPYLVCDKCNAYYKLEDGESADGFYRCACGNKLKYYESMGSYIKDLKDRDVSAKNIFGLWAEGSIKFKLVSISAILCSGILLIAGISAVSFNHGISNQDAVYGENQSIKPTLIVLYASWCPACNQYEQTFLDTRVQEKISKNYNFHKINVDQDRDTALKYANNGQILLPTTVILNINGNEIKRQKGYMTPDELLEIL